MKKEYWFPTAFSHWGDEEHTAMARVIKSGRYTMGEEVEAFEQELAAFNRRKHAVMVNSGSSANLIATRALVLAGDDEPKLASVPALAWATTYAPLVQHGINLRLRDCNDSWCQAHVVGSSDADVDINVAVSILGNPADALILMGSDINDDCEAFGATIDGRPTASFGTIATQSFFYSHQLSAIEGGACLTDDDDLAQTMRMLRDHGMTRSVSKPTRFEEEYDFRLFGYNVRPLEMHAAIAREQLRKASTHKSARRRNWSAFEKAVKDLPLKLPVMGEEASPFSLHFEVASPQVRANIVANLRANGIDCRLPTGGSFHMHEYGKPWADQQTPRADRIHRCGLFIGNAPYDIEERIVKAAQVMKETLEWLR